MERKGLLIELQYRTIYQHAWATSVEMVGILTEDQPKFDRGDTRVRDALKFASEIIARAYEGMPSCIPELSDKELVERFTDLDKRTNFLAMLRGLNASDSTISRKRNFILTFKNVLEVKAFSDATVALRALFEIEREKPSVDVVMVNVDSLEDVREAFKNYFTDAREFLRYIEEGCERLARDPDDSVLEKLNTLKEE
jgi:hypothetical protein